MANITTAAELAAKVTEMRKKQEIFATYSQEQVDKICYAVARAAIQNRISLAKMAIQETQMGVLEDKILKNHYAAEFVYHQYRDLKTCDVIEIDNDRGIQKIAAPMGLIGAILPVTNPTASAIFHILLCLKTRNAILVSPHPKAKACTCAAVEVCAQAAYRAGAPEGIVDCLAEPTITLSKELMHTVDFLLANGGANMVQAAYTAGKPAIGAGSGNCPVILHPRADFTRAVCSILHSKTFDAGLLCSSEQAVIVVGEENVELVKREFQKQGGYVLSEEECERVRALLTASPCEIIGKKAEFIAQLAGIPASKGAKGAKGAKVLIAQVSEISHREPFAQEKLCPILALYPAESYFQALDMAEQLLQLGGAGHTAGLYIDPKEEKDLTLWRDRMKACRLLVNTPTAQGAIGGMCNEISPALTLGCGTWGGSGLAGNLEPKHLLNVKTVAFRREHNLSLRLPQAVYHETGCTREALMELQETDHFQRVFFLTDHYLYQNGNAVPVLNQLERMGVLYTAYYDITSTPTIQQVRKGVAAMEQFQPDAILAMGGGSPLDAAKLMRYAYAHPEVSWEELQTNFLDHKKRVFEPLQSEKKTPLIAIATTAGTGAESSPYAVVTDEKTGVSWPVCHPELLPTAAIIDANQMRTLPKGLTREGGMSILTRAIESYHSLWATDYTDGFALIACKNVIKFLPSAYESWAQAEEARQKLADASALAGMAAANTFPGLVYGMACALRAWHHLPHGVACGILLPVILEQAAQEIPEKRTVFFYRPDLDVAARYGALAEYCGLGGASQEESFWNLRQCVKNLRDQVEIYPTIQAYGVEEAYFLDTLDRMTEVAWSSQWLLHSPAYPSMEELRTLYLRCYYGDDWKNGTKD